MVTLEDLQGILRGRTIRLNAHYQECRRCRNVSQSPILCEERDRLLQDVQEARTQLRDKFYIKPIPNPLGEET